MWSSKNDVNIFPLKVVNSKGSGSNIGIAIAINEVINYHKNKKNNVPSVINYSLGMMPSPKYPNYYPDETGDDVVTLDALKLATAFGIHVVVLPETDLEVVLHCTVAMMSKFTNGSMNLTQHESNNRDEGQGNPIVVGATDSYPSYDNPNMSPNFMSNFSNYGLGNTINALRKSLIIPRYDWEEGTNEVLGGERVRVFHAQLSQDLFVCI